MSEGTNSEIQQVFDHWVSVHWTGRGIRPVLTDKRSRIISKALKDYGVDNCKLAIDGCALSKWHQGQNPSGKKYNSIELILRDAEHIENFANLVVESPVNDFLAQ